MFSLLKLPTIFVISCAAGIAIGLVVRATVHSRAPERPAPTEVDPGPAMGEPVTDPGSPAAESHEETPPQFAHVIDLKNLKCPNSGNDVAPGAFTDWRGLRVHLCCSHCANGFGFDPEGALADAGIDYKDALQAMDTYLSAPESDQVALLAALKEKFEVVKP